MVPNHDFLYLSFGERVDVESCQIKPTVCLMIADKPVRDDLVASVVHDAIAIGCTFFMTWGSEASLLHDMVDEVIENGSDEWLSIITTAHAGEPLSDVLDFLYTGALPGNKTFRCLIVGDKPIDQLRLLTA